jgi:cytochrome c2
MGVGLLNFLMMKRRKANIFLFFLIGVTSFAGAEEIKVVPDKPAEYFFYRCAGCHTVGAGKLTGPDLITATQWSLPDLKTAVKKMEKNVGPLTQADISQIAEFLKDPNVSARIAKQKQVIEAKLRAELPPPSFETGKRLFRGQKNLMNGGPACISCHHFVNEGGSLGPDLTLIRDRASGLVLQSAIQNSSYKIMRSIYEKRKITIEESLHLSEYLSHPEKNDERYAMTIDEILSLAVAGLSGFFIMLWFLNRQRKGRTRENLIQKSFKR